MSHDTDAQTHEGCEKRSKDYQDESVLRELYLDKRLSAREIGDKYGVAKTTIYNYLREYNIPRRDRKEARETATEPEPWHDKEKLERLYWDKQLDMYEIAERFDIGENTVRYWMEKHDIPRYRYHREGKKLVYTQRRGYETVQMDTDNGVRRCKIHRLNALAWGMIDMDELFKPKVDIHHKNGIQWDNRESNLEALSRSEHMRIHGEQRGGFNS